MASILQSPADWIASPTSEESSANENAASDSVAASQEPLSQEAEQEQKPMEEPGQQQDQPQDSDADPVTAPESPPTPALNPDEPKGDPAMVPVYVKSLLPLFCRTYQSTMIASVKKSSLNLIKKMVYYLSPELLKEVCLENNAIVGE